MPQFTVPINGPNGPGFMTVNASSPQEAQNNANQGGNHPTGAAMPGGHQAHTGPGGTAVAGSGAGSNAYALDGGGGGAGAGQGGLGSGIQQLLDAIASGNKAAADEAKRQFDTTFGLDVKKFDESVRQYNSNLSLAQAGLTGTYNGEDTLASKQQKFQQTLDAAGLTGIYNGQQTLAGRASELAGQLQQATLGAGSLPKFGGTTGSAYGTGVFGMAQQQMQNIPNGGGYGVAGGGQGRNFSTEGPESIGIHVQPNASGGQFAPGWTGQNSGPSEILGRFRSPTDVVARNYVGAGQNTRNMITSAISRNTGMDQGSIDEQIKSQLPKQGGPQFGMASI